MSCLKKVTRWSSTRPTFPSVTQLVFTRKVS